MLTVSDQIQIPSKMTPKDRGTQVNVHLIILVANTA